MKSKLETSIKSILLSTIVGSPIVYADDLEIYTGTKDENALVNIIFMMDTSGSMTSTVYGTNETRMRQAKDALKAVVNDLPGDMRVGLGRYNTPAGSVLTPARALDDVIELDITIQPTGEENDAYERDGRTEETIVFNDYLKFEPNIYAEDDTITSDNDDAEQCVNGSNSIVTRQYASFPYDGSGCVEMNGFIFTNLDIPKGATITSAKMELITESASSNVTIDVFIEDETDSPSFRDITMFNRDYLSQSVPWTFSPTSRYTTNQSPDLKDLVQKIVDKNDWDENNNVLSFKLKSRSYNWWDSYNTYYTAYNSSYRPKLSIKYRLGDQESNLVGIRFDEVQIPSGSDISSGLLKLRQVTIMVMVK